MILQRSLWTHLDFFFTLVLGITMGVLVIIWLERKTSNNNTTNRICRPIRDEYIFSGWDQTTFVFQNLHLFRVGPSYSGYIKSTQFFSNDFWISPCFS
ncbi:hypothetical protein KSP39_PZI012587 [Platanthera zijinensis]|uniref:Uncharacterized protein n=1 Tax=Platanthera zijinensis TaxID=2320716 RepID=A0AAP0G4V2_9ASPA